NLDDILWLLKNYPTLIDQNGLGGVIGIQLRPFTDIRDNRPNHMPFVDAEQIRLNLMDGYQKARDLAWAASLAEAASQKPVYFELYGKSPAKWSAKAKDWRQQIATFNTAAERITRDPAGQQKVTVPVVATEYPVYKMVPLRVTWWSTRSLVTGPEGKLVGPNDGSILNGFDVVIDDQ